MNVGGAGIVMGRLILTCFSRLVWPVTIIISLWLTWNCLDRILTSFLFTFLVVGAAIRRIFAVSPATPTNFHSRDSGWILQLRY